MPEVIAYKTTEEWLAMKDQDLSSTEIAALYGLSPYCTPFELYTRKHEGLRLVLDDNERMSWGKIMEPVIAARAAAVEGLTIRHIPEYMRHSKVEHFGSSFDYEIIDHPNGPGLMECKNVDKFIYMDQWTADEAPAHIETQVQVQMEVADVNWCLIAVCVGGNELHLIYRERNRAMGAQICKDVEAFWAMKTPPDIDWVADSEFILKNLVNDSTPDVILDLRDEPTDETPPDEVAKRSKIISLATEYLSAHEEETAGKNRKSAAKTEALHGCLGDAEKVLHTGFSISCKTDKKGTRKFLVTKKKAKGKK